MPINPLLRESSYGCKVICGSRSTYEMRKIRRYTEWQSMPYKEKSQYDEFESIKLMAHNASMPKIIVDEALRYHKKITGPGRKNGLCAPVVSKRTENNTGGVCLCFLNHLKKKRDRIR